MVQTAQAHTGMLPHTSEEFLQWESNDGYKYEWDDGEIIKWSSLQSKHIYIYHQLIKLFYRNYKSPDGTFINKAKIHLSPVQVRLPDTAYFTDKQIGDGSRGIEIIPGFVIEYISEQDRCADLERKIIEYFKGGVKVIWVVVPEHHRVYVHTSPCDVKACIEGDLCSAAPVLPDFKISVSEMLML